MRFRMLVLLQSALCLGGVRNACLGEEASARNIASRTIAVDGVQLHYLTAGQGPAVILLHGFAETSRMWKTNHTGLSAAVYCRRAGLPGIGDSSIPEKIGMVEAARQINDLARLLQIDKARRGRSTTSG
jgi:hypothetical protein